MGAPPLIADQALAGQEAFQRLEKVLSDACPELEVLGLTAVEPQTGYVDQQLARLRDFLPEVVVGVGGGSIIDLAKAVAVLLYNPGPAADYQGPGLIKVPGAKKIMIPTTAGTGSEVTPGAVRAQPGDQAQKGHRQPLGHSRGGPAGATVELGHARGGDGQHRPGRHVPLP